MSTTTMTAEALREQLDRTLPTLDPQSPAVFAVSLHGVPFDVVQELVDTEAGWSVQNGLSASWATRQVGNAYITVFAADGVLRDPREAWIRWTVRHMPVAGIRDEWVVIDGVDGTLADRGPRTAMQTMADRRNALDAATGSEVAA